MYQVPFYLERSLPDRLQHGKTTSDGILYKYLLALEKLQTCLYISSPSYQTYRQRKMRLRSSGFLKWSSLPLEIRRMILNTIVDLKNPRWSALASVSKEWQSVIGARNMAKLKLRSPPCFEGLGIIARQRHLVRHIYLSLDLPTYNCALCRRRAWHPRCNGNDVVTSRAIRTVLSILATWKTTGPLTLELNATSVSDTEHWAKNFRFDDDHDACYQNSTASETGWHDPAHGWENGFQVKPPSFFAMQQLFGPVALDKALHPKTRLNVTAVTCLMIRRQFRRCLVPSSLDMLLAQLVCLTEIIYEPWSLSYTYATPWGYFESRRSGT